MKNALPTFGSSTPRRNTADTAQSSFTRNQSKPRANQYNIHIYIYICMYMSQLPIGYHEKALVDMRMVDRETGETTG